MEKNDCIGKIVSVYNEKHEEYKAVRISKVCETECGTIYFDESGIPYREQDINFDVKYVPSLDILMFDSLKESGVYNDDTEYNKELMIKTVDMFVKKLFEFGYLNNNEQGEAKKEQAGDENNPSVEADDDNEEEDGANVYDSGNGTGRMIN